MHRTEFGFVLDRHCLSAFSIVKRTKPSFRISAHFISPISALESRLVFYFVKTYGERLFLNIFLPLHACLFQKTVYLLRLIHHTLCRQLSVVGLLVFVIFLVPTYCHHSYDTQSILPSC